MVTTEDLLQMFPTPRGEAVAVKRMLADYKATVDTALKKCADTFDGPKRLSEACRYALLSEGKRFRPVVVLMVSRALGKNHDVMDAALAVECFHAASLVADDLPCMDDDDERRDQPTVHSAYDEATAVLVSYALIAAGYEKLVASAGHLVENGAVSQAEADRIAALAVQCVSRNTGTAGATGGQYLDLFPPNLSEATLREVLDRKTVTLFEISFVLGWLYGGGSHEQLDAVKKLAYHFGMAFQIADDFGDLIQDAENERTANLAAVMGTDHALQVFHSEIASYNEVLAGLEVEGGELEALGGLLQHRAIQRLPKSKTK